ncbi:MAG: sigma-70 family RNA polymerase sigma factor [Rhizobiales bacterium]|nr:sigma-70 family RNA polymerase sigma factor [Hyphomicrobiales bacterium]
MNLQAGKQGPGADLQSTGDAELLGRAARRDALAFGEIVNRYYKPVYRVVSRMTGGHADTEDLAQEAFLKLWRNPGQVREAGALKGWLMRVASNAAIDRSRRRVHADIEAVPEVADTMAPADKGIDRQAAVREIERRIAGLPDRQRLALLLVYYEGMSNIEAAAVMETSIEAIESLLARARRSLKDSLSGDWRNLLDGLNAPAT